MHGIRALLLASAAAALVAAQTLQLNVSATPKAETIPYQYGVMFEVCGMI